MKNQRHHTQLHVALILALVGLTYAVTLLVASSGLARSVTQSDSGLSPLASHPEKAQTLNSWSTNGPDGGAVWSLAIDPGNPAIQYAGNQSGVFKSTDGGESWSRKLADASAEIVAIAPATPATIYAAGAHGVYKSVDGGTSWNAVNQGLENQNGPIHILALTVDPSNPNIVYAAGPDTEVGGTFKAIYKSTDGGASWSITKHSIRSFAIHHALAIDPTNPNVIHAGGSVGWGTVWKSTNGGSFWTIVDLGPDSGSTVRALTIDPTNTNVIYAGTADQGVFRSTDGGITWSEFNDGLPVFFTDENGRRYFYTVSSIVIDPSDPSVIYAGTLGVFKSSNGGSWTAVNAGLGNRYINTLAISFTNPNIICAGSDNGIIKTINSGASWHAYNRGLRGVGVNSVAVNPGNASVYAGTYGGTFQSINHGGSWNPTNFYPVAFDPHNLNTIYARLEGSDALFESSNGGATWNSVTIGPPNTYVSLVAIDPNNANVRYAAADVLYKSIDGGGSWSVVGNLPYSPYWLVIDPGNPQTLYAPSSADGGDSFTVYTSLDGGATWNPSAGKDSIAFYYVSALAIDPKNSATLYAVACAADPCGIYKSTDRGENWTRAAAQVPNDDISSLVVDPIQPNVIYVGTYSNGVFKSSDGGASLNPFNDGLTDLYINALAIDASGNFLHAGTAVGVFDVQLAVLPLNEIDEVQFFVRQQYRDFLGREPDPLGFQNWTDTLTKCPNGGHGEFENPDCDRVHVSAGFFQSNEFLGRGYWILRFGFVGLNRSVGSKRSSATYAEFIPALQQVGGSNSPAQEEAAKVTYANAFATRSDFQALFPASLSNSQYVNALEANAGVTLSNKQALIDGLNNLSMTRADVLRNVVESQVVFDKFIIPSFVTMEYFGYLRRDVDEIGYRNWVDTLTADPSNYRHMIFGFIYSTEYRSRFGQP